MEPIDAVHPQAPVVLIAPSRGSSMAWHSPTTQYVEDSMMRWAREEEALLAALSAPWLALGYHQHELLGTMPRRGAVWPAHVQCVKPGVELPAWRLWLRRVKRRW